MFRSSCDLNFLILFEDSYTGRPVQLPLGRNTFFFSSHIETFAWKINKTEVGSIILLLFGAWRLRQKFSLGVSWNRIFFFLFFYENWFTWISKRKGTIHPSLATTWLLATRTSPVHLVDESIITLFPLLIMQIRMLGESKVLTFLLLVLIKEMRRWGGSKIFLCNSRCRSKLLLRPSTSGVV